VDWRWPLFGFRGRIDRFAYWRAVALQIFLAIFGVAALTELNVPPTRRYALLLAIFIFVITIPAFVLGAKRLHDRDKSAWWLLLFYVVPDALFGIGIRVSIANAIATHCLFVGGWAAYGGRQCPGSRTATVCVVTALAIEIWTLIELGCLRGTVGMNRYGPEPLKSERPGDN
jgi:uncharacterized membrane protein YhaH (DUF805 family)